MLILYNVLLLMLVLCSIAIVITQRLRLAIILFGICSMIAAFVYLFLAAPDVALAEAVIGSTISTIIFLVGIRKYRVYTVCELPSDARLQKALRTLIEKCTAKRELEPHFIYANSVSELNAHYYDMAYSATMGGISVYGEKDNYFIADVVTEFEKSFPNMPIYMEKPPL